MKINYYYNKEKHWKMIHIQILIKKNPQKQEKKNCFILFENKYLILPSKRQSVAKHRVLHSYVGCLNCPGCETLLCLPHGESLQPPGSPQPKVSLGRY